MLLNDKLSSENWISAIVKEIVSVPMKVIIALSWYDVIEVLETAIYLTKCRKVYRNPKIKDNFKIVWLRLHVFLSVLEMGAAFFFFYCFYFFFIFIFFICKYCYYIKPMQTYNTQAGFRKKPERLIALGFRGPYLHPQTPKSSIEPW